MFSDRPYLPEGMNPHPRSNPLSLHELLSFQEKETLLEMYIERCDSSHNLHGTLFGYPALIPRAEAISPFVSGSGKEISVLSLVGKNVCCIITEITTDRTGKPCFIMSRKRIQERALNYMIHTFREGDLLTAVITSMCPMGAFADIGCGIIALLPIRQISVSRIQHPRERFSLHQKIPVILDQIDPCTRRFLLSHKELLGTWSENIQYFHAGETVTGIVRGIKPYGIFIELAPNLTGLAEADDRYQEGERVSVLIKAILPEKHKMKLHIISSLPPAEKKEAPRYFIPVKGGRSWVYRDS